jgi:hypothetical protein
MRCVQNGGGLSTTNMSIEKWGISDRESAHRRYIADREIQCRQYYANLLNRIGTSRGQQWNVRRSKQSPLELCGALVR